jgi:hypothetical protein
VEAESATALASAREDAERFVRKIALLEGELAAEHRVWEASERERQEQFEELTLLQTRGSELCHAVTGSPRARHQLFEGMRLCGPHPMTHSAWGLWANWLPNSRGWRSGAHGLRGVS